VAFAPSHDDPVALVLAGGGARGAYEVGALSALLPELLDDEWPQIIVGTSVGAINAAYMASNAEKSAEDALAAGIRLWSQISYGQVLEPVLSPFEARRLWSYVAEALGVPGVRAMSLLDPAPLAATLSDLIDFDRIHTNVEEGHLVAAAVVATSGVSNLSVVFHDGGPNPPPDKRRGIEYVPCRLTEAHVRASSAIPLLFPAVAITARDTRRWYFDGGTRLNTPIKPALELGARRLIVIALNALVPHSERLDPRHRPDVLDGATQLLQAVLVDPLVNDVHTLATINRMLTDDSPEKIRAHQSRTGRVRVPYMLIAPSDPDEIGRLANEVYRHHFGSPLAFARAPNLTTLGHVVDAAASANHGELLSYLFFAGEFTERLIELGRRDATRWLEGDHDHGRWQLGPL
jgi:NTE family protein